MSDPLAVKYYINKYSGPAANNMVAYIDCNNINSGNLTQLTTGTSYYNTVVYNPSDGLIWNNSGSVYLSGNYFSLQQNYVNQNVNINADSTIIMVYENMSFGGGVLFSNIQPYLGYSGGFEFGINADNNLYFQYFNDKGPQTLTSNNYLSDKSSVFINIGQNKVNFGYYDFFKNTKVSESFDIKSAYLFPSVTTGNNIYIGYNPNSISGYSYAKQFIGKINELLVFSPGIYSYEIDVINSGFASNYVSGQQVVNSTGVFQVTGYTTGITGYYSQITGHSITFTGIVFDALGNQYSGYQITDLTGQLYGTGAIALTGLVNVYTTGYINSGVQFNTGYILQFGKSIINVLDYALTGDMIDVSVETGIFYINGINGYTSNFANNFYQKNLQANYLYSSSSFANQFISQNSGNVTPIVYLNGLAQAVGTSVYSGNAYMGQLVPNADYYLSGTQLELSSLFNNSNSNILIDTWVSDTGVSQYFPYVSGGFSVTGLGVASDGIRYILTLPFILPITGQISSSYENFDIFYNGQKLILGQDNEIGDTAHYGITGYQSGSFQAQSFYFKNISIFNGTSGTLLVVPNIGGADITGNNFLINFGQNKYLPTYSKVYLNGIRLTNNIDYLECGKYDLRAFGTGYFNNKPSVIYNGDGSDFIPYN